MRSLDAWLGEYSESHRNPTNKRLHYWCVPAIQLSVMGLLWALPVPAALGPRSALVNWATLAMLAGLIYYAWLSVRLAVGMLLCTLLMFALLAALARLDVPLWISCVAIFVVAWIGQFIGHAVEGQRPSFFKDVQFLLIGPLWILSALFRRLGVRY
jgi:uncharacterized membrane protein YGL010W